MLLTCGDNFMSIVPLEIYLSSKSVMSAVLILPAGYSVENETDLCNEDCPKISVVGNVVESVSDQVFGGNIFLDRCQFKRDIGFRFL